MKFFLKLILVLFVFKTFFLKAQINCYDYRAINNFEIAKQAIDSLTLTFQNTALIDGIEEVKVIYGLENFDFTKSNEILGHKITTSNTISIGSLDLSTKKYDFYIKLNCQDDKFYVGPLTVGNKQGIKCPDRNVVTYQSLSVQLNQNSSATLSWSPNPNLIQKDFQYHILYGEKSVFNPKNPSTYNSKTVSFNTNETILNSIDSRKNYLFYIKALCQDDTFLVGPVKLNVAENIEIIDNDPFSVNGGSFRPEYDKKYVISAWVKEKKNNGEIVARYTNSMIRLFTVKNVKEQNNPLLVGIFKPAGNIIEGWQRIEGVFQIPFEGLPYKELSPNNLVIELINTDSTSSISVFFDDVRIFPFNSSVKSFVYDFISKKLVSELDENNYATYYEYDKEGGLIRVKKETERGIYTIQETRSSNAKKKK